MLITFSGIVGSGKSTNAKCARDIINDLSHQPVYLRFRFLSWRKMLADGSKKNPPQNDACKSDFEASEKESQPVDIRNPEILRLVQNGNTSHRIGSKGQASKSKQSNYKQQEHDLRANKIAHLTFVPFAGYLWRMLNFRLFRVVKLRQRVAICDRYFYDNLVHYRLDSTRERLYFQILKIALPVPDISFMLTAEPETIIRRRRHYDPNYIYTLSENYKKVANAFENLTVVKTDETKEVAGIIARCIREKMNGSMPMKSG